MEKRSVQASNVVGFTCNILIKELDGEFIAHCLELDIVATANDIDNAQREIISLICAQVDFAFSHDNLDQLFRPAPREVWKEFYACKDRWERKYAVEPGFKKDSPETSFVPPWVIANTCRLAKTCQI